MMLYCSYHQNNRIVVLSGEIKMFFFFLCAGLNFHWKNFFVQKKKIHSQNTRSKNIQKTLEIFHIYFKCKYILFINYYVFHQPRNTVFRQ